MAASLQEALARRRALESGQLWASQIDDDIFLGAGRDAEKRDQMQSCDVTHILNVADDVPNFHEEYFEYLRLDVADFGADAGISRTFPAAIEFCNKAIAVDGKVLIHCANGSNRSATVAIAVLMNVRGMSLAQAWAIVLSRRAEAAPLQDNRLQLLLYEKQSRGTETMCEADTGATLRPLPSHQTSDTALPEVGTRVRFLPPEDSIGGLVWAVHSAEHIDVLQDIPARCTPKLFSTPLGSIRATLSKGEIAADMKAISDAFRSAGGR